MYSLRRQPDFQITKVWAKNFRSIADTSVDMDRLTVFVGPNASGKSNLLDILRFIKDALRFDLEMAVSERQGVSGIRRQESNDGQSDIEIGIDAIVRAGYSEPRPVSVQYGFALTTDQAGGFRVGLEYGKIRDIEANRQDGYHFEFRIEDGNLVSPRFLIPESPQRSLFEDEDISDFDNSDLALLTLLRMLGRLSRRSFEDTESPMELIYGILRNLHKNLQNMRFYHIFPNTIREPQRLGNVHPLNEDAGNLASVLRDMSRERPDMMARLKDALPLLIPGVSDLEVSLVGGYLVVRLKHDSIPEGSWFDLSQESDGTIRLLGLLVTLYQRWPLPLIGIEEPELTVHPGALAVLADLLNEAARRSQVIVTTHSPDFIDCVTKYKAVENLRIVQLTKGVTSVRQVSDTQVEAVRRNLFSPGELHRMGELVSSPETSDER